MCHFHIANVNHIKWQQRQTSVFWSLVHISDIGNEKEMRNQRIQGTEKCYIILQHLNVYNVYSLLLWDLVYLRSFLKNTDFGSSEHGSSGKSHVQGLKFKLCYCSPKLKSTKNKNWLRAGGIALGCNYCVKFWIV
jgi:hypothetical protein